MLHVSLLLITLLMIFTILLKCWRFVEYYEAYAVDAVHSNCELFLLAEVFQAVSRPKLN